jgi:hypothetical protein
LEADEESEEEVGDEKWMSRKKQKKGEGANDGVESVLPPPLSSTAPMDLRKQPGDETPLASGPPKQLYQVIDQNKANADQQSGTFFSSEMAYAVPGAATAAAVPEGAESVLSKALPGNESGNRKRKADDDDEEDEDLGKNFKF